MGQFNLEKFIDDWWSQKPISYRPEINAWIHTTYTEPLPFWTDLFHHHTQTSPSPSSLEKFNFYHDCILRHLHTNHPALKIVQNNAETATWSYAQIDKLVTTHIALWGEAFPLTPGQTTAIILPYGIHFLVGLLAALKLGWNICVLPLHDRFLSMRQLTSALEELKPDAIITSSLFEASLQGAHTILNVDLTANTSSNALVEPHTYSAHDLVQKVFNPYALKEGKFAPLEANVSYLCPLRDALISLNLKPGSTWARPLFSMWQEEPCATLMALLMGATIVHVSDEYLLSSPACLKEMPIDVIGITPSLQQLWIQEAGCPSTSLKLWYKNPTTGNPQQWAAFNEINQLEKIASSDLLMNPLKGGFTLFSQPKPLFSFSLIYPNLGVSWKLLQQGSEKGHGLFQGAPLNGEKEHLRIAQIGDGWVVSGTSLPTREGVPYPVEEIETCVRTLDFVHACMILPEYFPQELVNSRFVLILFISPKFPIAPEWHDQILGVIQQAVGTAFFPDQLLFYPLYPKMNQGKIDRKWVQAQHQNRLFPLKQAKPSYQALNLLRQSLYSAMQGAPC